jgi:hypothetical protein
LKNTPPPPRDGGILTISFRDKILNGEGKRGNVKEKGE